MQRVDPTYAGGAGGVSLPKERRNFIEFGACILEFVSRVRHPEAREIPTFGVGQTARGMQMLSVLRGMRAGAIGLIEGAHLILFVASGHDMPGLQDHVDYLAGICSDMKRPVKPTGLTV